MVVGDSEAEGTVAASGNGPATEDELTDVERELVNSAVAGEALDLEARTSSVRAEVLRDLACGALRDCKVHDRGITVVGAVVIGQLDLSDLTIPHPLRLRSCRIDDGVSLIGACTASIDLSGSSVGGIEASDLTVNGDSLLDSGQFGRIQVQSGEIKGDLSVTGSQVAYTVQDGAELEPKVALSIAETRVGGHFDALGSTFNAPGEVAIDASEVSVGSTWNTENAELCGELLLIGARIDGDMQLFGMTIDNGKSGLDESTRPPEPCVFAFTADRLKVGGAFFVDNSTSVKGSLRLAGVHIGRFTDRGMDWPTRDVAIDGLVYDSFGDTADRSYEHLIAMVQNQRHFSPQPYRQLAQSYRAAGYDDWARATLIAKERDRRTRLIESDKARRRTQPDSPRQLSIGSRIWSLFLGASIAHGYKPGRVVWLLLVLWISGIAIFATNAGHRAMIATQASGAPTATTCPSHYPCFSEVIDPLETVVPLVNLGQHDFWQPKGSLTPFRIWTWVAICLGWILTTTAVAGLTGVIRRD